MSTDKITPSELNNLFYEVKNSFYTGNYLRCINKILEQKAAIRTDLLAYSYFAFLAIDPQFVIGSEVLDSNSTDLIAFRHLHDYIKSPEKRGAILEIFEDKISHENEDSNIWKMAASIVMCQNNKYHLVIKGLRDSEDIECMTILVQCLLKIHQIDFSKNALSKMREKYENFFLTELCKAWVYIASGGDQLQKAFYIYQEMCERFEPTPLLLNGMAVCHIHQGRFEEAEDVLKVAVSKCNNDLDTLINLVVTAVHAGKSPDVIHFYKEQLKTHHPNSQFILDLHKKEEEFDRLCENYKYKRI